MSESKRPVQLEFGIRNNKIIHIHELPAKENGKACNCVCPKCGKALIAKLGPEKQWHFAHHREICDIAAAQQTALHMLAKEIIEESKELLFPGISVKRDKYITAIEDNRVIANIPHSIEYKKPARVKCDSVTLEKKLSNLIPDIIVTAKGRKCLVEIAVTHFVDEEKEQKIRKLGYPLLEIDISDLYGKEYSRKELAEAVLYNHKNRRWIYSPLYDDADKWAKDEYAKYIYTEEQKIKRADQQESDKLKWKQQQRENGEKKARDTFDPDNYKRILLSLENENAAVKQLKESHIKTDIRHLPFFLNIPITGEMIFPCDRRIWQIALFDKFVYNRNPDNAEKPTVGINRVQKWITKHNKQFPIDWALSYKTVVSINSDEKKSLRLLNDVIDTYFNYLVYLGFLEPFCFQEATVLRTHSLLPPNKEYAASLRDALCKIDRYAPDIDNRIKQLLLPYEHTPSTVQQSNHSADLNVVEYEEYTGPKTNWKDIEKQFEADRMNGLKEVQDKDFNGNEPIYDSSMWRWLKCTDCGKLFRADQMASYGGQNSINKGICRECSRKL